MVAKDNSQISCENQVYQSDKMVDKVIRGLVVAILVGFMGLVIDYRLRVPLLAGELDGIQMKSQQVREDMDKLRSAMSTFNASRQKDPRKLVDKVKNMNREIQQFSKEVNRGDQLQFPSDQSRSKYLKNLSKLEQSYQSTKHWSHMLEINTRQLLRNARNQLFDEIRNKTQKWTTKMCQPWNLTRNNLHSPFMDKVELKLIKKWGANETARFEKMYGISKDSREVPICVVVMTQNNAQGFRFQYNLQSILNQRYSNYRIVVVDQGSIDGTSQLIQAFMKRVGKPKGSYILTTKSEKGLEPFYNAIKEHCNPEEVVVPIYGSDELLGSQVFRLLSRLYLDQNVAMTYSNFFRGFPRNKTYSAVQAKDYGKERMYRKEGRLFGPFVSFYAKYFNRIDEGSFKGEDRAWLHGKFDESWVYPLLELSCGKQKHIDEYLYLQNNGFDQHPSEDAEEALEAFKVRTAIGQKASYPCFDDHEKGQ